MKKIMYVNYIVSYYCEFNCKYCTLTKEQRKEKDYLDLNTIRRTIKQLLYVFKKHSYDQIIICITGDELHNLPNSLEYIQEALNILKEALTDIDREKIRIKMHTNANASKDFYDKHIKLLEEANRFAKVEFETAYQSVYHSPDMEKMLNYIQSITNNIEYYSSIALVNQTHFDKIKHLKYHNVIDFSQKLMYPKFTDRNINFLVVDKTGTIRNGCGYNVPNSLLMMRDINHCEECPNESCSMLNDINRI